MTTTASGTVVLCGRTQPKGLLALYECRFADAWAQVNKTQVCCRDDVNIEAMTVSGQEFVSMSCVLCRKIWIYRLEKWVSSLAFHNSEFAPGEMCQGEPGQMFVVDSSQAQKRVLLLDCSAAPFRLIKILAFPVQRFYSTCYIPGGVLVVSEYAGAIQGVSTTTERKVWQGVGSEAEPQR